MTGMFAAWPRRIGITLVAVVGCLMLFVFASTVVKAEQMVASWYGPGFEGNLTANGETFDPSGYTAASKTYDFDTLLIVTFEGRSAVVRVNDRGPYVAGRDLDLSQGAAEYLGLTAVGVGTVDVEVADAGTPTGPYGGTKEVRRPAPQVQSEAQPETAQPKEPVRSTSETPVVDETADTNQQEKARQDFEGISGDQYASTEQYTEEIVVEEAVPPAPPAPKPAVPVLPPEPEPEELEAPPAELVVPNSTIERRVVLEVAAPPAPTPESTPEPTPESAPEPAPEPAVEEKPEPVVEPVKEEKVESAKEEKAEPAKEEKVEPVKEEKPEPEEYEAPGGITVLPDTGGAPVGVLVSGVLLFGAGLAVRTLRR